jgi:hypothetical protein
MNGEGAPLAEGGGEGKGRVGMGISPDLIRGLPFRSAMP